MRIRTGMRRMTTQMLSSTRRRAGLSARKSPLLSSVRSSGTGTGSRMDALRENSTQSNRILRSSYEKLEKSAASLAEQTKLLAEKADLGGKECADTVKDVVEHFNDTMKYLKQSSGVLNNYYRQTLKEVACSNKAALEEIGVLCASDGSLSVDSKKLESADAEKVKAVLGSSSDFAKRIGAVAGRAADNARANAESVSSQYTKAGGLASSYLSRYNFRG
mgnify:CR=1 FL=1